MIEHLHIVVVRIIVVAVVFPTSYHLSKRPLRPAVVLV